MKDCWKCGGSGHIEKYAHIEDGRCFACDGTGKVPSKPKKLKMDSKIESLMGKTCKRCMGSGTASLEFTKAKTFPCPSCGGTGKSKVLNFPKLYHVTERAREELLPAKNNSEAKQHLGVGMYATLENNVQMWSDTLSKYKKVDSANIVELDTSNLNIFNIGNNMGTIYSTVSKNDMANTIMNLVDRDSKKAISLIDKFMPKGEILNGNPEDYAYISAYLYAQGFDGISSWDYAEGDQVVIFEPEKVQVVGNTRVKKGQDLKEVKEEKPKQSSSSKPKFELGKVSKADLPSLIENSPAPSLEEMEKDYGKVNSGNVDEMIKKYINYSAYKVEKGKFDYRKMYSRLVAIKLGRSETETELSVFANARRLLINEIILSK